MNVCMSQSDCRCVGAYWMYCIFCLYYLSIKKKCKNIHIHFGSNFSRIKKYHKSKVLTKLPKYQIGNSFVKTKNVNNLKEHFDDEVLICSSN